MSQSRAATTSHAAPRRRRLCRRLQAIVLACLVLGTLSILGTHYLAFGVRRSDVDRWAEIARTRPVGTIPGDLERDFNQRFVPSVAARTLLRGVDAQAVRVINSERVTGPDGMRFVREDIDICYSRPLLDRADDQPRAAIETLGMVSSRLRERGIRFIVVPVPSKASIYPARLYADYDVSLGPNLNAGHDAWMASLQAAGVEVFDPTWLLWEHRAQGMYFDFDTHWTPRALELTAAVLAKSVAPALSSEPRRTLATRPARRTMQADLREENDSDGGEMTFDFAQVVDAGGVARFDDAAAVLVVGDSNIHLLEDQSGGLAHQMALNLQQDVQSLGIWGGRAKEMIRAIDEQEARLARKKVVILVFAMRKLLTEEWDGIAP